MQEDDYVPEAEQRESIIRDPEVYSEMRCPNRYGKPGTETRSDHIWNGHGDEFKKYGYNNFGEVLPDLVNIAENPDSARVIDSRNGNTICINPEKSVVVVVRERPFHRSSRYPDITTNPPEPPVVVTAYTLSNPEKADKIITKHSQNLATAA